MSFECKVNLLITDIPIGVPIPFVFEPSMQIPSWNMKLKDYVESMFIFADYLFKRGVLFFFLDDLHVLKEISSFACYQDEVGGRLFPAIGEQ